MVQCCVPFCKSRQGTAAKYSFHEFPVTDVRFEWLRRIARKAEGAAGSEQWVPSDRSKVCSRHFRQEDYRQDLKIRLLRPDAVPSIFPTGLQGEEEKRGPTSGPSTDGVPVDSRVPEEDKVVAPRKKSLRVAKVQRPVASAKAANKRAAPSQRPSQEPPTSASCSSGKPVPSAPENKAGLPKAQRPSKKRRASSTCPSVQPERLENPAGLPKAGTKRRRLTCSGRTDQARASSRPVVIRASALNVSMDSSLPKIARVPSVLRAAPSGSLPGLAKPAPSLVVPQEEPSPAPLCASVSASQTCTSVLHTGTSASPANVSASQASTSVLHTGTSASQTNVSASQTSTSVLHTGTSASPTNVSASQASTSVLHTGTSASQTNVSALQTSTSVLQTGTSALQTNVSVLQMGTSASQTSVPASQTNGPASQTSTSASQTGAPATQKTSGAMLLLPQKQLVRLVQVPNTVAGKGLLSPAMQGQVRIIVPGRVAASKPLLVSLKSLPKVVATATTEPAKGDLSSASLPAVQSTHLNLNKSRPVNANAPEKPAGRHVRTWGSQTRLSSVRLRHMIQRFQTAQRKCLKLQADRQRLQAELAAACQKARQAQAFVKQLRLNRFQEGLARRDPRCLFLEEQLRSLGQSKHRWGEDTLQSCLHWHTLAPRGYRLIAQSGLLALPSGSTLKRHLHSTTSATPRNPPSPTGDTLPDNIDWGQVDCGGAQESSSQQLANSDRPATRQPESSLQSVVEVVVGTEETVSPSVVLDGADTAKTPAQVDGVSRETRTASSDFNLVPASVQQPVDATNARSRLPQSVVEVVVSGEEVVSSSVVLDNAETPAHDSRSSQKARMACPDFNLVSHATIPGRHEKLRVIYVTLPTSGGNLFSTDTVLASGVPVLPVNRNAVQPLMHSPDARTESNAPCLPSTEYVVQAESSAEELLPEDDRPPKDLAELLSIVGAEPL